MSKDLSYSFSLGGVSMSDVHKESSSDQEIESEPASNDYSLMYYYKDADDKEHGPYTIRKMREKYLCNELSEDMLIQEMGTDEFIPSNELFPQGTEPFGEEIIPRAKYTYRLGGKNTVQSADAPTEECSSSDVSSSSSHTINADETGENVEPSVWILIPGTSTPGKFGFTRSRFFDIPHASFGSSYYKDFVTTNQSKTKQVIFRKRIDGIYLMKVGNWRVSTASVGNEDQSILDVKEERKLKNGYRIDIRDQYRKCTLHIFNISHFDEDPTTSVGAGESDASIEQKNNLFVLHLKDEQFSIDLDEYNSQTVLSAIVEAVNDILSMDICMLIEQYCGNINHYIAYIVGINISKSKRSSTRNATEMWPSRSVTGYAQASDMGSLSYMKAYKYQQFKKWFEHLNE